jgi:hypothetical protein
MTAHPLFAGIGGHHGARPKTVEWLTPPDIIQALGGPESFGLDPCAPVQQPYPTAKRCYTINDNGLIRDWGDDRVFLNPPYTAHLISKWLARMATHNHGTALIFARTETDAFFRHVWEAATALLFMRGRINFHLPDGTRAQANAGAPTVLCAYGMHDADILAFCGIRGKFVPLRIARSVLVTALSQTWREALQSWFSDKSGPVGLDDIYRAFDGHPKTKSNPTWRATLRRTLQEGPFDRVRRGQWKAA